MYKVPGGTFTPQKHDWLPKEKVPDVTMQSSHTARERAEERARRSDHWLMGRK